MKSFTSGISHKKINPLNRFHLIYKLKLLIKDPHLRYEHLGVVISKLETNFQENFQDQEFFPLDFYLTIFKVILMNYFDDWFCCFKLNHF